MEILQGWIPGHNAGMGLGKLQSADTKGCGCAGGGGLATLLNQLGAKPDVLNISLVGTKHLVCSMVVHGIRFRRSYSGRGGGSLEMYYFPGLGSEDYQELVLMAGCSWNIH